MHTQTHTFLIQVKIDEKCIKLKNYFIYKNIDQIHHKPKYQYKNFKL